jgi:hypothetical protein
MAFGDRLLLDMGVESSVYCSPESCFVLFLNAKHMQPRSRLLCFFFMLGHDGSISNPRTVDDKG